MADLMEDNNLPPEKRREFIDSMRTGLDRMEWLVLTLLKLARLDANAVSFKKEAVSLSALSRTSQYTWVKRYRQNSVKPFVGSGHIKPEDAELKRLQREVRELREENEILKKAAAYFAKKQK